VRALDRPPRSLYNAISLGPRWLGLVWRFCMRAQGAYQTPQTGGYYGPSCGPEQSARTRLHCSRAARCDMMGAQPVPL
jgi:hypothetical protein